jgi:ArsR family transcriptional regulator
LKKGYAMIDAQLRDEVMRMHAQVCAALADPTRILLLYSIAEQPQSVGELVKTVGVSQPTVSKHLQNLRERRMVTATRDGQNVIYSLTDSRIIQALDLLRSVLADNLNYQASLAEQVDITQISGGNKA